MDLWRHSYGIIFNSHYSYCWYGSISFLIWIWVLLQTSQLSEFSHFLPSHTFHSASYQISQLEWPSSPAINYNWRTATSSGRWLPSHTCQGSQEASKIPPISAFLLHLFINAHTSIHSLDISTPCILIDTSVYLWILYQLNFSSTLPCPPPSLRQRRSGHFAADLKCEIMYNF